MVSINSVQTLIFLAYTTYPLQLFRKYHFCDRFRYEWTDGRTSGQKKMSSLTFISMTHITIKTIRHLVSETQTDRQRQFISRYIYIYIYIYIYQKFCSLRSQISSNRSGIPPLLAPRILTTLADFQYSISIPWCFHITPHKFPCMICLSHMILCTPNNDYS